ncbi:hypothetical protein QVD17_36098 [Tagetes erecta]|uniref:F-box domain-containing protein n=1 Tax=Tagetes erecta TaxID=13708 RepID=A0AAD8JVN8_TARER|nr:hypothetical protein QVD17_36098 [Tagetes erecta]
MKAKGGLDTIYSWKSSLETSDEIFLKKLLDEGGLFTPLFFADAKIKLPTPLIDLLLKRYNRESNVFDVRGKTLSVTLEDILYLTHLPIDGKPVLCKESPSKEACEEVFGNKAAVKIKDLESIAFDKNNDERQRKVAVLKMIVGCFIMPSYNGYEVSPTYVELLKDLDEVPKYAWGSALLAFLVHELQEINKKKDGINGNLWIVLAFFFVRIPTLWKIMGITELSERTDTQPLLSWVLKNLQKKCNDNKGSYVKLVEAFLDAEDVTHEDINWRPYLCCKLPNTLQSQSDSRRFLRLGPIFNNNYVVHHRPDRVLAQFGIQDDDISISMIGELDYKIKFKDNRGKFKRNYEEIFKRELDLYRRNIMLLVYEVSDDDNFESADQEENDRYKEMARLILNAFEEKSAQTRNNGHNSRTCTMRPNASIINNNKKQKSIINSKQTVATVMKQEEIRNWLDLPYDVTANILNRISMADILRKTQKVCTAWYKICKDLAMWRVINMNDLWCYSAMLSITSMCKHAVDRSQGQLVDITLVYDDNANLLQYVADRSSQLRRLELVNDYFTSIWSKAVMKFPLLEELNLYKIKVSKEDIETVGRYCPMLKTLKVNEKASCLPILKREESMMSYNEIAIAIGQNLPELRHLEVIGNNMTNIGLQAILDNCHHLETLDLRGCFNIVLKGDLEKKCFEHIKYLKLPNNSLEDCPYIYEEASDEDYNYYECDCDGCGLFNMPQADNYNFADNFDPYDIDAYNDALYDQLSRQGPLR